MTTLPLASSQPRRCSRSRRRQERHRHVPTAQRPARRRNQQRPARAHNGSGHRRHGGAGSAGHARSRGVLARHDRRQDGREHQEGAGTLSGATGERRPGRCRAERSGHDLHDHRPGRRRPVRGEDPEGPDAAGELPALSYTSVARSAGRAVPLDAATPAAAESDRAIRCGRTDSGAERRAARAAGREARVLGRGAGRREEGRRRAGNRHRRRAARAAPPKQPNTLRSARTSSSPSARRRRR